MYKGGRNPCKRTGVRYCLSSYEEVKKIGICGRRFPLYNQGSEGTATFREKNNRQRRLNQIKVFEKLLRENTLRFGKSKAPSTEPIY